MQKLLRFLNIRPDKNQKYILISLFLSGLLLTYVSPAITKAVITDLPAEWIAFSALFGSISGLLIGVIWKGKTREFAAKFFMWLAIAESTISFLLSMFLCFVYYNVWVFAITSLLYTSFISVFVGKCIMAFKAALWNDKEREGYDNNIAIVDGIVAAIGFSIALLAMPSLKVGLFLWGLACIIDDIGWIYVYYKNKDKLKFLK
jgi:uncharacterized protein YacL